MSYGHPSKTESVVSLYLLSFLLLKQNSEPNASPRDCICWYPIPARTFCYPCVHQLICHHTRTGESCEAIARILTIARTEKEVKATMACARKIITAASVGDIRDAQSGRVVIAIGDTDREAPAAGPRPGRTPASTEDTTTRSLLRHFSPMVYGHLAVPWYRDPRIPRGHPCFSWDMNNGRVTGGRLSSVPTLREVTRRDAGDFPADALLASGSATVCGRTLWRSMQLEGSHEGFLMATDVENPSPQSWTEVPRPAGKWGKRIYTLSSGVDWVYGIFTRHTDKGAETPVPEIYCLEDRPDSQWQHVKTFQTARQRFGAHMLQTTSRGLMLVIAGGCRSRGPNRPLERLRSVEYLTLDGPTAGEWQALPDLPRSCTSCRFATYQEHLCLIGKQGATFHDRTKVLTLPLGAFEDDHPAATGQGIPVQETFRPVWNDDRIAPMPNSKCGITVASGILITVGGQNSDRAVSNKICAYDVISNTWRVVGSIASPRLHPRLLHLNGYVLLIAGRNTKRVETKMESLHFTCV